MDPPAPPTQGAPRDAAAVARAPRTVQNRPMLSALQDMLVEAVDSRLPSELLDRIDELQAAIGDRPADDFGFTPEQIKYVVPLVDPEAHIATVPVHVVRLTMTVAPPSSESSPPSSRGEIRQRPAAGATQRNE